MWRFYFWFVATVRSPQRMLPVRKQVGEISDSAVEPSRFPRGRPAPRELSAPQPPFASVTMRWQAGAEQFSRRSATRSFNEVWQTHLYISARHLAGYFTERLDEIKSLSYHIVMFYVYLIKRISITRAKYGPTK